MFYEQVDHWGHAVGPRAEKLADVIRQVDGELVRVLGLLDTTRSTASGKKLSEVVNVMIFSDHGMTPIIDPVSGIFRLDTSLLSPDDVVIGSKTGPVLQIYPKENENVVSIISCLSVSLQYVSLSQRFGSVHGNEVQTVQYNFLHILL